jgi:hypothetical protein
MGLREILFPPPKKTEIEHKLDRLTFLLESIDTELHIMRKVLERMEMK